MNRLLNRLFDDFYDDKNEWMFPLIRFGYRIDWIILTPSVYLSTGLMVRQDLNFFQADKNSNNCVIKGL